VTVAAASDLSFALTDIAAGFERASGCTVRVSSGSSGNFYAQIQNGAPFDVFFSADVDYPGKLEAEGLAAPGSTHVYAVGKIVLWVRADSGLDPDQGFAMLRDPGDSQNSHRQPGTRALRARGRAGAAPRRSMTR
jgi:molybdate transport system substrate-binding protein